ncbi:MAG: hypothetical protein Q8843_02115, partial [Candidatus Phytoplasma australasiaticum]|nr:hypothetical protein [Candidatus Phytoplasma australasiaticum]
LNKIQYCSSNSYSLKRELQQGMNNFYNTSTAFNKIVGTLRPRLKSLRPHRKSLDRKIHLSMLWRGCGDNLSSSASLSRVTPGARNTYWNLPLEKSLFPFFCS